MKMTWNKDRSRNAKKYKKERDLEQKKDKSKKLNIEFPPMYYSTHVAVAMAMILSEKDNWDWFYSNFIQIMFSNEFKANTLSHLFQIYPAELTRPGQIAGNQCLREIYIDRIIHKDIKDETIIKHVIEFIENDYYVSAIADVSKFRNLEYAGYNFFKHGIFVFGYDHAGHTFDVLDFDSEKAIKFTTVSFEDYIAAFTSRKLVEEFDGLNNSINLFKTKRYHDGICVGKVAEAMEDYVNSYDTSKRYALLFPKYDNYTWGISVYDKIVEYIKWIDETDGSPDYRLIHGLYEHKKIMYDRFEYFRNKDCLNIGDEKIRKLKIIFEKSDTLRMLYIKYSVTGRHKLADSIIGILEEMKNEERLLYTDIAAQIKKNLVC